MNRTFRLIAVALMLCALLGLAACTPITPLWRLGNPAAPIPPKPTRPADPTKPARVPTYVITVVDEDGSPVPGAAFQLCKDSCVPGFSDEEGRILFYIPVEDGYHLAVTALPEGYELSDRNPAVDEENGWYLEKGVTEVTVILSLIEG